MENGRPLRRLSRARRNRLAPAIVAPEPPDTVEAIELRGAGIVHAAEAMGLLRGIVGFLTFLLAFDLKANGVDLGAKQVAKRAWHGRKAAAAR